jgi:GrpB-like predicted nucleotidyltransferase (UPF0157 family)
MLTARPLVLELPHDREHQLGGRRCGATFRGRICLLHCWVNSPRRAVYILGRMANADPVIVVHYDEAWPSLFEEERKRIEGAIGPWAEGIEHVGSTAVPGLAAKPVIDIMVGVKSLDDSPILVERLVGIGYEYVPQFERDLPFRRYFRKMREGRRTHQIHLVERSNAEWWDRHMLFRDYLRANPEIAGEYARLKYDLSARFGEDRDAYTDAKTHFISEVVRRAQDKEQI